MRQMSCHPLYSKKYGNTGLGPCMSPHLKMIQKTGTNLF